MQRARDDRSRRADFLVGAAVAGAGLLLGKTGVAEAAASGTLSAASSAASSGASSAASIQQILNTALTAEQLAMAFYYKGLTTPAIMHDHRLGGPSADPNNPGQAPGGDPANVKDMQSILDSEVKHAQALLAAGAQAPYKRFYFPKDTFRGLGASDRPGSFLQVMDALETAFVGAYLAAVGEFVALGRSDLAGVIVQIMGVESEHRMLGRLISGFKTANNLTLQKTPFSSINEVGKAVRPFVTGQGFPGGAGAPVSLPTTAQAAHVVGRYATRIVTNFL
jgi:hypothetical protein